MINQEDDDMKNSKACWIVIIAILIVILAIIVPSYNELIGLDENVKTAYANVETMMQRRLELIPDMVETVKSYAAHEEKIFNAISFLNTATDNLNTALNSDSTSLAELDEANTEVTTATKQLLAYVQDTPEITASEQYTALMDSLEGSVNRISYARTEYNETVAIYNKAVRSFPMSILAKFMNFKERETFKADPEAHQSSIVNFD